MRTYWLRIITAINPNSYLLLDNCQSKFLLEEPDSLVHNIFFVCLFNDRENKIIDLCIEVSNVTSMILCNEQV